MSHLHYVWVAVMSTAAALCPPDSSPSSQRKCMSVSAVEFEIEQDAMLAGTVAHRRKGVIYHAINLCQCARREWGPLGSRLPAVDPGESGAWFGRDRGHCLKLHVLETTDADVSPSGPFAGLDDRIKDDIATAAGLFERYGKDPVARACTTSRACVRV